MEIIQYKTKKTIAIIMLLIMIMSIATPVFAATIYTGSISKGDQLKFTGTSWTIYKTETAAKNLDKSNTNGTLKQGQTITVKAKSGNVLQIGTNQYIYYGSTGAKNFTKVTSSSNTPAKVETPAKTETKVEIPSSGQSSGLLEIGGAIVGGLVNVATSETTTVILGKIVDIIMNILKTVFSSLSSISIKVPETVTPNSGTTTTNNVIDTSTARYLGKKYTGMTEQQKKQLAYIAYNEQGSVGGAKIELSLMANRTEYCRHSSVYNYVMNSGWFRLPKTGQVPSNPNVSQSYIDAVEEVLVEGKRYLPSKVVEHDWIKDISSISTGDKSNRSCYIPDETIIKNNMGSTYVFFGFAPDGGDPFGYFQ